MRRTRPKTEADPGWEEISWDEALSEVVTQLGRIRDESGPEAVAFALSSPSGTALSDSFDWILRFIRVFGSPNICDAMEICNWQKDYAHRFTFGYGMPQPDYENADLVLLWGFNPANSWLAHSGRIARAQARGAKVVSIDPHRTGHAAHGHWIRIRPGTDGLLALAVAGLLIERKAYDDDFVRRWTNAPLLVDCSSGHFVTAADLGLAGGPSDFVAWDVARHGPRVVRQDSVMSPEEGRTLALRGRFQWDVAGRRMSVRPAFDYYAAECARLPLAQVSTVTGVPQAAIVELTDMIAAAKSVCYHAWTGIAQHANATQTERAIALLYALTGCFDAKGGNVRLNRQPVPIVSDPSWLAPGQRDKALGLSERPVGPPEMGQVTAEDVYTAVLEGTPYRVRAMVAFGSNILSSRPEPERGRRALEALEFHVHADMFMTPSAQLADIVLPINSPWEREALRIGFEIDSRAEEHIQLRPAMVPSVGESRSDLWLIFELARRLGLGSHFFDGDIESAWNHLLKPMGLSCDQLRQVGAVHVPVQQAHRKYADITAGGPAGFPTQTRRVEIYSELLARNGQLPVPSFTTAAESGPEVLPIVVTNARRGVFCHSQHRSIVSLRRRAREPVAELSPALMQRKGINDGDWIRLTTGDASVRFKAKADPALLEDVVVADYGWWERSDDLGLPGYGITGAQSSNFNLLSARGESDPVSGARALRSIRCDVELERRCADQPREFLLTDIAQEAHETISLALSSRTGDPLPDFLPGQHLTIERRLDDGRTVARSYSLSSAAVDPGRSGYRVTVKAITENLDGVSRRIGAMSSHLHGSLRIGDVLKAAGPRGTFCLAVQPAFPIVMLASGVGITPFMSFLETAVANGLAPRGALYYGNRNGGAHIFASRLTELRRLLPEFDFVDLYSRPLAGERQGVDYDRIGRVAAEHVDQRWIDTRARFYMCGPEDMMRAVTQGLTARGVPRFEIFEERFAAARNNLATQAGVRYKVRFSRSGVERTWSAGAGTLMEFAERLGVKISSGCRVGQCESCVVAVLQGRVTHVCDAEAIDADACLTCQAVPASDLVLDA